MSSDLGELWEYDFQIALKSKPTVSVNHSNFEGKTDTTYFTLHRFVFFFFLLGKLNINMTELGFSKRVSIGFKIIEVNFHYITPVSDVI